MTKPILTTLLTGILAGNTCYSADRFHLEKVWEVDAARLTRERSPLGGHPVHSVSFSPDGRWLAAVVDDHGPKAQAQNHLVILNSMKPENDPISVDLPRTPSRGYEVELSWSSRSDLILASPTLVNLSGTVVCTLPEEAVWRSMFMSDSKIVALRGKLNGRGRIDTSVFLFFEKDCTGREPWEIPGEWFLSSVNPDTGGALIKSTETKFVDLNSRTIGATIGGHDSEVGGYALFANGGKSVCRTGGIDGRGVACFDIASGKLLGEAPVNGGGPMATAAHSPSVVLTDWRYYPYIIMDGGFEILRKRIVWDFETKEAIVSWGSGNQRYYQSMVRPRRKHLGQEALRRGDLWRRHLYRRGRRWAHSALSNPACATKVRAANRKWTNATLVKIPERVRNLTEKVPQ
jgi:hypothetical protein